MRSGVLRHRQKPRTKLRESACLSSGGRSPNGRRLSRDVWQAVAGGFVQRLRRCGVRAWRRVCSGSIADIASHFVDVRFTPKSRLVHLRYQRIVRTRRSLGIRRSSQTGSADFVERALHHLRSLVCSAADRAMFLLFLHGRHRYQVQNQGRQTSGIDIHRLYLC